MMKTISCVFPRTKLMLCSLVLLLFGLGCGVASNLSTPTSAPTDSPSPSIESGAPVIQSVELRQDSSSGELVIYQDVHFTDIEGDVNRWDFEIVSTTNPDIDVAGGELDIPSSEQKTGAVATGDWGCGNASYIVTMSVWLTDNAGHQSAPYEYTLNCFTAVAEEGDRYTETTGGFSYIPPTGWEVAEIADLEFKAVHGPMADNFAPNIIFLTESFSGTLDDYVDASVSAIMQALPGTIVLSLEGITTNDGNRCLKVVFSTTQSGINMQQTAYIFDGGQTKYTATYSRLADSTQENDILVDQSMKTFRIEN